MINSGQSMSSDGNNNSGNSAKKRSIFRANVFYQFEPEEELPLENRVGCIFLQAADLSRAQYRANEMVQKTLAERKLKVPYKITTTLSSKSEMDFFCEHKSVKSYNGIIN